MDWIQLGISVCASSCLECCIKNYTGSTRIIKRSDMLLMIESGMREGIATISHCQNKANNEYMGTEFDPTMDSKFISYLDANSLYGWAM